MDGGRCDSRERVQLSDDDQRALAAAAARPGRHVEIDVSGLDRHAAGHLIDGLAAHFGYDLVPLAKGGEGPDLRSPELNRLVELARTSWEEWGEKLIDALVVLGKAGKLVPMTLENEELLASLFADHEAALVVRLTGHAPGDMIDRLIRRGLVSPTVRREAVIPLAFQLGKALPVMETLPERPESRATLAELVKHAMRADIAPDDRAAVEYMQRRGMIYMRRPAVVGTGIAAERIARMDAQLTDEELRALRIAGDQAVRERATRTRWRELLGEAMHGHPSLQNDMDRIARTEAAFAHGAGAIAKIREESKKIGDPDPLVYRPVSPRACTECKRIFGEHGAPIPYRLSVIMARDAAGGNYGLPRDQWGPVSGPVHPNCTCPPPMRYNKAHIDAINAATKRIMGR